MFFVLTVVFSVACLLLRACCVPGSVFNLEFSTYLVPVVLNIMDVFACKYLCYSNGPYK